MINGFNEAITHVTFPERIQRSNGFWILEISRSVAQSQPTRANSEHKM